MRVCDLCGALMREPTAVIKITLKSLVPDYLSAVDSNGNILSGDEWKLNTSMLGFSNYNDIEVCTNCVSKIPVIIKQIKDKSFSELGIRI
jgi:hypothetical protein